MDFLEPVTEKLEAIEYEAMAARGAMGWSFGGLGLPYPDTPEARAVWNALIGEQEEEKKGPGALIQSESLAFDSKADKEFEELLHDPKMQDMLQMTDEKASMASSFLESGVSAEATHMLSMQITA